MNEKLKVSKIVGFSTEELKDAWQIFLRFAVYLRRYWKLELLLLILGNFFLIFTLINPYLAKLMLDKGILAKDPASFIRYTIIGAAIFALRWGVDKSKMYLKDFTIRRVKIDLSRDVFAKINRLSLRFFQERSTGEMIYRISGDIDNCSRIAVDVPIYLVLSILKVVYITAVIAFINYKILALVIVYQVLVIFRMGYFLKKRKELMEASFRSGQGITRILSDFFSHIYFIKASGTGRVMTRKYFNTFFKNIRLIIKSAKISLASEGVTTVFNKIFFGVIGFIGSLMVIRGSLTLGSLGAIMAYFTQGTGAYGALIGCGRRLVMSRISLKRMADVMDSDMEIREALEAKEVIFESGRVEFKDVCFAYQSAKPVLEGLSFNIQPKANIALIGRSGCGKTTTLNLILRLFDVDQGAVLLDGYDLRDLRFKSIYDQTAVALQEPFLWNDTVAYNISFGSGKRKIEEVIRAAKLACAHDFIMNMPEGYDTLIGEHACRISQGQRQRIAIARALIKKPKILLLDEAMSSLDSETEDKIIDNILKELKHSTVIVVSHRLSAVKKMDSVYFLQGPNSISIGEHEELLNHSGYRELFASQIEEERSANLPDDQLKL
ncbi:ABC transporter ATP-binding protein [Candidatus Omnitrophota bacterium]